MANCPSYTVPDGAQIARVCMVLGEQLYQLLVAVALADHQGTACEDCSDFQANHADPRFVVASWVSGAYHLPFQKQPSANFAGQVETWPETSPVGGQAHVELGAASD